MKPSLAEKHSRNFHYGNVQTYKITTLLAYITIREISSVLKKLSILNTYKLEISRQKNVVPETINLSPQITLATLTTQITLKP